MELIKLFLGILLVICLIFSINLQKLNTVIKEISPSENNEPNTFLGLYLQDFKGRVRVADVLEYTPARSAGIEAGDRILEVEGIKVKNVNTFIENIQNIQDKEKIKLLVYRVDSCSIFPVEVENPSVYSITKK